MKSNRKRADQYFHQKPENWNCAQAVLKAFEKEFNLSAQEVADYKAYGGGRAEDGICGALFAIQRLLSENEKDHLESEFRVALGSIYCLELKQQKQLCEEYVAFADKLVERWLDE